MGYQSKQIPKTLSPEADSLNLGALEQELFGSFQVEEEGPHFVYAMTPWGDVFWTFFTSEQWSMVNELAHIEGKELEETVQEAIMEKYFQMRKDMGQE